VNRAHVSGPRLIVALDYPAAAPALALADSLDPSRCRLKVGKELFVAAGPGLVRELVERGYDVFLDLKFHDIPATVAAACHVAADLGVWMLNVHASGGRRMLEAATDAVRQSEHKPLLFGVTVLTSLSAQDFAELGCQRDIPGQVMTLATLCEQSGLDGVVCSAREADMLRREMPRDFRLVTPGIRPAGSDAGDQRRVLTPAEAIRAGVDYLVIGRPITAAVDPLAALQSIEQEITTAAEEVV